jgi:hypothetical protein
VTQVTPEAPAHPCLLQHYSQDQFPFTEMGFEGQGVEGPAPTHLIEALAEADILVGVNAVSPLVVSCYLFI